MLKDSMTARPDGMCFDAAGSITDIKCAEKRISRNCGGCVGLAESRVAFGRPKLKRKRVCISWRLRIFQCSGES